MGVKGVSDRADKVYHAMKSAAGPATRRWATPSASPWPRSRGRRTWLNCLWELEGKGYVKRKARDKAAGYYITKLV